MNVRRSILPQIARPSLAFAFVAGLVCSSTSAQSPALPASPYNPLLTFAPLTLPQPVNSYRAANGSPGPAYWQNRADYDLHATIDTAANTLSGEETITYTNNSPEPLNALWLQLDQNTYRADARSGPAAGGRRGVARKEHTEGYVLDVVDLEGLPLYTVITDTRLQVHLPVPLAQHAVERIHLRYLFTIPGPWGGRMSHGAAKQGEIYDIAQWYPRMCVFDDLHGWDTLPYLANEFYLEYGNFTYAVTVPANMIVAGSGELVNPQEVLSPTEQSRLAKARQSDKTVLIRTPQEMNAAVTATSNVGNTTKTWHFHMENTRDVSFSASATFVWDAARMNLPAGKQALAMSFYPSESVGQDAWSRSTEYLKDSVERFSARWFPYPYPNAVNVAGPSSGMEYPGILFDGIDDKGKTLFFITAHEIGHTWFPMIVGSDERRDAWIDEGFNTFIDTFESDDFEDGVYGQNATASTPLEEEARGRILSTMTDPDVPVILTRADAIREKYRHPVTYFKSAFGLTLLREDILGPERFDFAFRKFIADWAFKHPSPSDFFRSMESAGGEDLSYFWRGWYMNNWLLDMAVTGIAPTSAGGSVVSIENRGQLVMPVPVELTLADGTKRMVTLPAETWIQKSSYGIPVDTPVKSAILDPNHTVPLLHR